MAAHNAHLPVCGDVEGSSGHALGRRRFIKESLATGAALLGAGTLVACDTVRPGKADTIVTNGRIATLDKRQPFVSALAIKDRIIVATGSEQSVMAWRGPDTKIIDVDGRTVIPGINDSHTHFIRTGINYAYEVRWDGVPSLADALQMLRDQARRTPPPNWVQVLGGWSAYQFVEKRMPTLAEINAAAPDTPAYVLHLYDRAFVNRAGLRALGWGAKTPDPPGGYLERDASGNPTGLIVSTKTLLAVVFPTFKFPQVSLEDQIVSMRHFMREMNRFGVTSVNDAAGGGQAYPANYRSVMELAKQDQLTLRIAYTIFPQRPGREAEDFTQWVGQLKPGQGTDFFRLMGGGEVLVWSAVDPANFAYNYTSFPAIMEGQLTEVVKLIAAKGWPFRLHATYDESVVRILGVLEKVHREVPIDKLRWIIDHAETISPRSLERVAAMGGAIAIQNRMSLDGEAFLRKQGAAVAANAPPIEGMRKMGIPLAAGTDGTRATSYNPWIGLHWLITGKTLNGTKLNGDHNLVDRMEALRFYSAAGAWFTREERRKGTLEPGKLADLAVLSADYFAVPEDDIKKIEAMLTMVGGKVVYGAGRYAAFALPPLPISPDWLPIKHYGGYRQVVAAAGTVQAVQARGHTHPVIVGENGAWTFGCHCAI